MTPGRLLWAPLLGAIGCVPPAESEDGCHRASVRFSTTRFHGENRAGAYEGGGFLHAGAIAERGMQMRWASAPFHTLEIDGVIYPPLVYASPLFVAEQQIATDEFEGTTDVVYTATTNGWVYAIGTDDCEDPGRVLWRSRVSNAVPIDTLDQGVPLGVLSTPIIDDDLGKLYVSAYDGRAGWQLHALSLRDGTEAAGWPVTIDDAGLAPVNTNGPATFHHPSTMSQRGALAMSPDGSRVYVPFGTYWGSGTGWLVGIDTAAASISSAFSSAPSTRMESSGGIWGSAGPHVDAEGRVWATTGNSPPGTGDAPGVWGNSLIQLDSELRLERAYSPFNYCALDDHNMDLGASQPHRLAPVPDSSTPNLIAFGGKQGVVYLLDVDAIPNAGLGRGPCSTDAAADRSLHSPSPQPQFDSRGPLSVFGPYSDEFGEIDHAKMRTKLAEWSDEQDNRFLFASGTAKESRGSTTSVAPSIAKLRIALADDGQAVLEHAARNEQVFMQNPGSPIVTGAGDDASVWVLDRNAPRSAPLLDTRTPHPRLYAFAASDLRLLWSGDTAGPSGKYASPIGVGDTLVVGTDRIEAWSLD
ncbi:MAG: hypothetical protein KUG77_05770 [Nannocystaceae bacterium]|nr:hypothetical protein [Nannocystaceae bacterium]